MAGHCLSTLQVENIKLNDWVIVLIKEKMRIFYPFLEKLWNTQFCVSGGCQKVYIASNLSSQTCGKRKEILQDYLTHRSLFWKGGCWAADCCRLEGEAGESSLYAWPALGLFSWPLLLAVDRVWPPDLLFDSWQLFLNHHTDWQCCYTYHCGLCKSLQQEHLWVWTCMFSK